MSVKAKDKTGNYLINKFKSTGSVTTIQFLVYQKEGKCSVSYCPTHSRSEVPLPHTQGVHSNHLQVDCEVDCTGCSAMLSKIQDNREQEKFTVHSCGVRIHPLKWSDCRFVVCSCHVTLKRPDIS